MNANAKAWTPNPAAAAWSPPKPTSVLPVVKLATDEVQLVKGLFIIFIAL
jgi:hypothetical protein